MSKGRGRKARTSVSGSDEVNGEEAAALKALLESGTGQLGGLTDSQVLRVLKANKPCEGLYSKACKVRSSCFGDRRTARSRNLAAVAQSCILHQVAIHAD